MNNMRKESEFEEDLKLAIKLMRIFGMLPQSNVAKTEVSVRKESLKCFSVGACVLAMRTVIAWVPLFWHTFRLATTFAWPYFEMEELYPIKYGTKINRMSFYVISILWDLYCAAVFTVYGPLWVKRSSRIQTLWEETSRNNAKMANSIKLQRYQVLVTCVNMTLMLSFFICYAYLIRLLVSLETSNLAFIMIFAFEVVLFVNQYCSWAASMNFLFFLCYQLRRKFAAIKIQIKKGKSSLVRLQEKHQKICLLTEAVDNAIQWHVALTYCIMFFCSCIRVREVMLTDRSTDVLRVIYNIIWYWIVLGVSVLLAVCVSTASVNTAAHDLSFDIYEEYLKNGCYSDSEVFLFIERLNGSHIGFSFLGFFVITRTSVLSLSSLLMTYFVIIVQFSES